MRAVVQRVSMANVMVDGREVGRCGPGLLLLVGVHKDDTVEDAIKLAEKISRLRIFNDPDGRMSESLNDRLEDRDVLAVSNFTVYGDASRGARPSYSNAMPRERAEYLFNYFVSVLRGATLVLVQTGVFGADMKVSLVNDGPVTVIVDSPNRPNPA